LDKKDNNVDINRALKYIREDIKVSANGVKVIRI
jgi:hypothetical protein